MDMTLSPVLATVVDRLAAIKAQVATLNAEADALKDVLVDTGLPFIDGTQHRVAISQCPGRPVIDWRAIAEKLNPSRQLVVAHTTQGEAYTTVRVSARRTS